ncbi:hypothetical protein [Acinetobacter sp. WCHAc060042]|uniref:hypothetical protein n=1 Tax=Acinetobacter sp. WCHAc060042 TaxID=2213016 RepID=UPI000DA669C0|nr:hypothetical protein [Acinetobacter sp. WCHAc060042]
MSHSIDQLIHNSLIEICQNSKEDFSGLGIICYEELSHLPYISLHQEQSFTDLDLTNINETLLKISTYSSAYHDGFHFYDINSKKLTHISQFISPLLNSVEHMNIENVIPCGAREMTAYLTSSIQGIFCVGLISANRSIKIFKNKSIINQQVSI